MVEANVIKKKRTQMNYLVIKLGSIFLLLMLFVICLYVILIDNKGFYENDKVILSHVIVRHGDRTPAESYPDDPNTDEAAWPVEYNELTNEGTRQHYILGQWLRIRYFSLLPERYSPKLIYARSTDVDRTIESSMACLAGMFPPTAKDKWNSQLNWNPIPVHVVPKEYDYLIGVAPPKCPTFDTEINDLVNSAVFDKILAQSKYLRNYLTEHSGYNLNTTDNYSIIINASKLRDTLLIETINNMIIPEWTKFVFPSTEFDNLGLLISTLLTRTPTLIRIKVGFLLKEIVNHCLSKVAGTLTPDRSMYVYTTHDSVLTNFLNGLKIFDNKFTNFAACILLELRLKNHVPYLQIFYKNDPNKNILEATPMFIPDCGYMCKLSDFIGLYSDILPTEDFPSECNKIE